MEVLLAHSSTVLLVTGICIKQQRTSPVLTPLPAPRASALSCRSKLPSGLCLCAGEGCLCAGEGWCLMAPIPVLCVRFSQHRLHVLLRQWGFNQEYCFCGGNNGSAVKSSGRFSRGPGLGSQHPHGSSQSYIAPIPGICTLFWPSWQNTYVVQVYTCKQSSHTHKIRFKKRNISSVSSLGTYSREWLPTVFESLVSPCSRLL